MFTFVKVLDACAAPGNKTVHLASLMGGQGKIIACELNGERAKRLENIVSLSGACSILDLYLFLMLVLSNKIAPSVSCLHKKKTLFNYMFYLCLFYYLLFCLDIEIFQGDFLSLNPTTHPYSKVFPGNSRHAVCYLEHISISVFVINLVFHEMIDGIVTILINAFRFVLFFLTPPAQDPEQHLTD